MLILPQKMPGLQAENFTPKDFTHAQKHVRILSGLYGVLRLLCSVLRPLDLMQPYRLEMGTKLNNKQEKDLYAFWRNIITENLNQALSNQGDNIMINLASDKYFNAVNSKKLDAYIVKPIFLDEKQGKYKVISFYAKKARGLMSRFIIQNQLKNIEQLTEFNLAGYQFDNAASKDNQLVFKRSQQG